MTKYRFALQYTIVAILTLIICACSSGGGGLPANVAPSPTGLSVTITSPDATVIDTTDDQMTVAGVATSDVGVSSVSWESDHGEKGSASGTDAWEIASIPLEIGANTITVTASNSAGESRTDKIVINRESAGKGSVTLSWTAPTQRTDETPLSDLTGYKIFYGRMSGIYDYEIDVPQAGIATYVVENLVPGDWYFTMSAYDSAGLESAPSNEVLRTVQ